MADAPQEPRPQGVEVAAPTGVAQPSGGVPARVPDPVPEGPVPFYTRFWRWWLPKAGVIAGKQNAVLAWLTYHLGLRPVAVFMRRQDRLDRVTKPVGETGWHEREDPIHVDPDRIRRPV
ncbi:MAG: hypothetical protein KDA24_16095 [Deltaproteobacteria bacterium]|nr:hypothetical protein [Deltaproteobacteria bacterium]